MANSLTSLLKLQTLIFTLVRLLLTFTLLLISPILLLFYGVLSLYRLTASKLAHHFDPKLGKIVNSLSSLFAAHDVYGNSYTTNVALHVVGKIDRFHLIHSFEKVLAESVTPEEGQPLYPELTQRIVTKFGYKFWRNVDDFQVDSHISYLNPENPDVQVSLQDVREAIAAFGKTPMDPEKSPWHVYIVKNFNSEENAGVKSAMIMRLHHCMFDGHGVLSVFGKLADNGPLVLGGPKFLKETRNEEMTVVKCMQAVAISIAMFFRGPYELIGQLMSFDDNELIRLNRRNFKGVMRFHECEAMSLKELKDIKNFYGVSMTSLVTTLVARGLRELLETRKINAKKVHVTFPLPVFNHPNKLRNYFSGGIISLDLGHNDPPKMLQAVEQKYSNFRLAFALGLPKVNMLLLRMLGSLPTFLVPRIDNVPLSSTLMHSSFPGPVDLGYFCGFPVVDATVAGSISKPYPVGTLCFSYNGIFKIGVTGDANIFSTQQEIEEMGNAIYQEFLDLSRSAKLNSV